MTETGASRLAFVTSWWCWSAFSFCVLAAVLRVATFNRASRDSSVWSALGGGGVNVSSPCQKLLGAQTQDSSFCQEAETAT